MGTGGTSPSYVDDQSVVINPHRIRHYRWPILMAVIGFQTHGCDLFMYVEGKHSQTVAQLGPMVLRRLLIYVINC